MMASVSRASVLLLPCLYLLPIPANALELFERLSFGHLPPIRAEGAPVGENLPNWDISVSEPFPLVFDDRVSLTHGWEGNTKGAIWTKEKLDSKTFMLDMEFRAAGATDGGGDLMLWLIKERPPWPQDVNDVYGAGAFEGLGIIIDQYGGQGGSVRGFMSDGSVNYSAKESIDHLAFGHCYYPYRNLEMPSRMKIRQTDLVLTVEMDDELCFKTETLIPEGYHFGLAAATAQEPDGFDIEKFLVYDGKIEIPTAESVKQMVAKLPRHRDVSDPLPLPKGPPQKKKKARSEDDPADYPGGRTDEKQDTEKEPEHLEQRREEKKPLAEDENGAVVLNQDTFNELFDAIGYLADKLDYLHLEILSVDRRLNQGQTDENGAPLAPADQLNFVARRIENIEGVVTQVQKDIESRDYMDHLNSLHDTLEATQKYIGADKHDDISGLVSSSMPRLGWLLFIILGFQLLLAAVYVAYKRKRAKSPNKLL